MKNDVVRIIFCCSRDWQSPTIALSEAIRRVYQIFPKRFNRWKANRKNKSNFRGFRTSAWTRWSDWTGRTTHINGYLHHPLLHLRNLPIVTAKLPPPSLPPSYPPRPYTAVSRFQSIAQQFRLIVEIVPTFAVYRTLKFHLTRPVYQ